MKKLLFGLILIMIVSFLIAQDEDRIEIIFVSEPGVEIFSNGGLVATIGISGRSGAFFSFQGKFVINAAAPDDYIQVGEPQIVETEDGKVLMLIPVKKAAYIGVASNIYPVSVFIGEDYYGKIKSIEDLIKIPAGAHRVVLKAPGYKEIAQEVIFEWREKKYLKVNFKEKIPFEASLYIPKGKFSPNGDWENDELKIGIMVSLPATCTLTIVDKSRNILKSEEVTVKEGMNWIYWDGKTDDGKIIKDGTYTAVLQCNDLKDSKRFVVDTSKYTYKKELSIAAIILLIGALGALIYYSM